MLLELLLECTERVRGTTGVSGIARPSLLIWSLRRGVEEQSAGPLPTTEFRFDAYGDPGYCRWGIVVKGSGISAGDEGADLTIRAEDMLEPLLHCLFWESQDSCRWTIEWFSGLEASEFCLVWPLNRPEPSEAADGGRDKFNCFPSGAVEGRGYEREVSEG